MMRITTMAIFLSVFSYAQKNYSVNGIVKDQSTGEAISGAVITVKENPEISIQTNAYGFYSLTLPESDYTLIINYNRRKIDSKTIYLHESLKIDWALEKEESLIDEVVIKNQKKNPVTKSKLGADILDIQSISKVPVFMGEKDIIKTLQFLPGISSSEGTPGFIVRGGSPDQNLILLDQAPVFNNSHLLGFFSNFNSDALRDVTVYKENMPSQYGGRLSSIVDVKMKDGNNQGYNVNGGIGLISSRLSVEGPLQKGKSSFMVSARRSYMDFLLKGEGSTSKDKLYFYDFNAKGNYQINKNNSIYLSGYIGRDVMSFSDFKNNWGNIASSLRWNSILNSKLFSNTILTFSNYDYKTKLNNYKGELIEINPNIRNIGFKQDFTHYVDLKHTLNYGLQTSNYNFYTPKLSETVNSTFLRDPRKMWESALYINDEYKVTDKFFMNYGVRLSMLSTDNNKLQNNPQNFKNNYFNLEPRLMLNYEFNHNNSIRLGYSRNTQNLQTLVNGDYSNFANDIWLNLKKPQVSDQVNLGYTKKFDGEYEINSGIFYKKMANLVDFKDGADVDILGDMESNLVYNGKGRSYGFELLAKKTKGRFTGWFSYTLSKSQRQNDEINNGNWYNATIDKTHNLSIVANYQLAKSWTISGAFVYSTGNAVTYPSGKYEVDGATYLQYGERNADRMPDYHRLDLNVTYEPQTTRRFKSSISFGVYNAYARKNPYSITFEEDRKNPNKIITRQTSLFSVVPNVTYNFKF